MPRASAKFRKAELTRAIRAVIEATGVDVSRLRVRGNDKGYEITVRGASEKADINESNESNEWDNL